MEQPLGQRLARLTDLDRLTMAACHFEPGMAAEATFSLFIRKYPAGLAAALNYLENLRFAEVPRGLQTATVRIGRKLS